MRLHCAACAPRLREVPRDDRLDVVIEQVVEHTISGCHHDVSRPHPDVEEVWDLYPLAVAGQLVGTVEVMSLVARPEEDSRPKQLLVGPSPRAPGGPEEHDPRVAQVQHRQRLVRYLAQQSRTAALMSFLIQACRGLHQRILEIRLHAGGSRLDALVGELEQLPREDAGVHAHLCKSADSVSNTEGSSHRAGEEAVLAALVRLVRVREACGPKGHVERAVLLPLGLGVPRQVRHPPQQPRRTRRQRPGPEPAGAAGPPAAVRI
mmetsp:Transcript_30100/g.80044  ORF Transcript_30100/g.80044 Transcript_30100/m.80044 type:complete len:263 (-) Transcript_30100:127-915(-)